MTFRVEEVEVEVGVLIEEPTNPSTEVEAGPPIEKERDPIIGKMIETGRGSIRSGMPASQQAPAQGEPMRRNHGRGTRSS